MDYVMNMFNLWDVLDSISNMHGREFTATASYGDIVIVPLYHPAVALYNGSNKETLLNDFQILKKYV